MAYRRSSSISSKSSTDVPDSSEGAPFVVDAAQAPAGADDEVDARLEVGAGPGLYAGPEVYAELEVDAEPHAPSADLNEGAAVDITAGDALTGGVLAPDTRLVFEPGAILNGMLHAECADDGGLRRTDEDGGLRRTDESGGLGRTDEGGGLRRTDEDGELRRTEDAGVCGATGGNATSSSKVAGANIRKVTPSFWPPLPFQHVLCLLDNRLFVLSNQ